MFPLQQSDDNELAYQILSNPCQQDQISQDLIMNYGTIHPSLGTTIHHQLNHVNIVIPKKKRLLGTNKVNDDDLKLKKIMHRDLERQRRQGMSALHSSLTSLLSIHFVKGKRSVSDHMHEAVKYIKELQEDMNE
ncbi:hypothetical protein H5410_031861 [Solanum commersonii]|uniref:BHLH domain-containing protein n=1 Tax=Solanum commersonii TaxID=4109 RepID=A0A9J5YIC1_SOLCO|nr:hypothetical protein H5410_031861 [Solanum commersonii]